MATLTQEIESVKRSAELWFEDADHAYWKALKASEHGQTPEATLEALLSASASLLGMFQQALNGFVPSRSTSTEHNLKCKAAYVTGYLHSAGYLVSEDEIIKLLNDK